MTNMITNFTKVDVLLDGKTIDVNTVDPSVLCYYTPIKKTTDTDGRHQGLLVNPNTEGK
jgi:hypothetical protein